MVCFFHFACVFFFILLFSLSILFLFCVFWHAHLEIEPHSMRPQLFFFSHFVAVLLYGAVRLIIVENGSKWLRGTRREAAIYFDGLETSGVRHAEKKRERKKKKKRHLKAKGRLNESGMRLCSFSSCPWIDDRPLDTTRLQSFINNGDGFSCRLCSQECGSQSCPRATLRLCCSWPPMRPTSHPHAGNWQNNEHSKFAVFSHLWACHDTTASLTPPFSITWHSFSLLFLFFSSQFYFDFFFFRFLFGSHV